MTVNKETGPTSVPSGWRRTAGAPCGPPGRSSSVGRSWSAGRWSSSSLGREEQTRGGGERKRRVSLQSSSTVLSCRTTTCVCSAGSWRAASLSLARGKQSDFLPGNLMSSAGRPLCCSAWTSLLHCVVFPALSTPSSTISAPRLQAIAAGCVSSSCPRGERLLQPGTKTVWQLLSNPPFLSNGSRLEWRTSFSTSAPSPALSSSFGEKTTVEIFQTKCAKS